VRKLIDCTVRAVSPLVKGGYRPAVGVMVSIRDQAGARADAVDAFELELPAGVSCAT
jgi:hypothetical protein